MNLITLHRLGDGSPFLVNAEQICYMEHNGDKAVVVMANRAELRVTESVEAIEGMIAPKPVAKPKIETKDAKG